MHFMVLYVTHYSDPPQHLCNDPVLIPLLFVLKMRPSLLPLGISNIHNHKGWGGQLPLCWILIYHRGWYFSITPWSQWLLPIELTWTGGGGKSPQYPLVKPRVTCTGKKVTCYHFSYFGPVGVLVLYSLSPVE